MKLEIKLMILAVVTIWLAVVSLPDGKLHVVFCDVGQGDAILITYKHYQMLVDTGPNKEVISCLARHVPFYDKKIETVVLTHDNSDHSGGMLEITKRYKVNFWKPKLRMGQAVVFGPVRFLVEWPDSRVLGADIISVENEEGIVGRVVFGDFDVLLTADVSTANYPPREGLEVFKVPHHGSRTGLTKEWIEKAKPKLAVISVGKNSFGHPAQEVIKLLSDQAIEILRTDQEGDIEIISDGKTWRVK